MTKSDILKLLKEKAGLATGVQAESAYNALFVIFADTLKKGEPITIPGFGSFKTVDRAARQGRNPRTGEVVQIQASKTVKFTPSKNLKTNL